MVHIYDGANAAAQDRKLTTFSLKNIWKASPQCLRYFFCAGMSMLRAKKRSSPPLRVEPVYVCAPFGNNCGMAMGGRLYADNCAREGLEHVLVDITDAARMNRLMRDPRVLSPADVANATGPGHVVIHANPPQFQFAISALGRRFLAQKHVTAYWSWELEKLPALWKQAFAYADSIDTPSTFVQNIIRAHTSKPVNLRPHVYTAATRTKKSWAKDGILRCLYIFDGGSTYERKNPFGALAAFSRAFKPGEATLTFKIVNADADRQSYDKLRSECAKIPGTDIITSNMNGAEIEDLYLRHDVYLSLHRSEGFGLTIFEALRLGLYAVATGWSGNMDFMNGERALAVPCNLVPVRMDFGAFKNISARWADPDIDAAASILRDLRKRILA